MTKTERRIGTTAFHVFLFVLFLTLLAWPILAIADHKDPNWTMLAYLFLIWASMIILLFFVAATCGSRFRSDPHGQPSERRRERAC